MFTEKQSEVIIGSLLGDATIWTGDKRKDFLHQIGNHVVSKKLSIFEDKAIKEFFQNCLEETNKKFVKSQSMLDIRGSDKSSYMDWHMKVFDKHSSSVKPDKYRGVGNKFYYKYTYSTHVSNIWNNINRQWYQVKMIDGEIIRRKIIPQDIKLTPLTLCVWHMDDGSANPKDANIELNTQNFTVEEVEFLIERLKEDLSISAKKKKSGKKDGQYKIYIGRKSYFDFMEMIKPHIEWDCFKYKIDTETYDKKPHRGEDHSKSKITEDKARLIFEMKDAGKLQKEIAKEIGVSKAAISLVLSGNLWQHLGMKRETVKKPRITKQQKEEIAKLHSEGVYQKEIAERLNINQSTVSRVLRNLECHASN